MNYELEQIGEISEKIISYLKICNIIALEGDLGSGKTTLIKNILKKLGVKETITSPTFSYLNIYTTLDGKKVYHFDLYRLNTIQQFIALGFDEFLYNSDAVIIIEWPEIIEALLKKNVCFLKLEFQSEHKRKISFKLSAI